MHKTTSYAVGDTSQHRQCGRIFALYPFKVYLNNVHVNPFRFKKSLRSEKGIIST